MMPTIKTRAAQMRERQIGYDAERDRADARRWVRFGYLFTAVWWASIVAIGLVVFLWPVL